MKTLTSHQPDQSDAASKVLCLPSNPVDHGRLPVEDDLGDEDHADVVDVQVVAVGEEGEPELDGLVVLGIACETISRDTMLNRSLYASLTTVLRKGQSTYKKL